jgi:gluconate kinase
MTPTKIVILLFGEMGSGKSYWGKWVAAKHGFTFIEGDNYLPDDMRARTSRFRSVTRDMVNQLTANMAKAVLDTPGNVVISQALYQNSHRKLLLDFWEREGYEFTACWVKVGFWQNLRQLWRRPRGMRWILYWLMSKPFFEKPTHPYL